MTWTIVVCPCGAVADARHPYQMIHRSGCLWDRFKERTVVVDAVSASAFDEQDARKEGTDGND